MADRRSCSHRPGETAVLFVSWCERCAGWRCARACSRLVSYSDSGSVEVLENHFLPQEETSPDELQHLIQRLFRSAQEWQQDYVDHAQLEFDTDV